MIRLINSRTGREMWVADRRLNEYLAAGHRLAAGDFMPEPMEPETGKEEPEEKPEKKPSAKKKPASGKAVSGKTAAGKK